ncbi:MAG: tRNA(Ile)-lysidine synthetase [Firmicutes bacterium]|nr:tRNA(Ile)-lysidine synthetase [Bacillota bacterium]MDI6707227.1 tRNA lysidine(34) synthetase TilS [Bacillota bacterium]
MKIEDAFIKAIEEYEMLKSGDRVVVGVSGGPDSITLLHLLHRYRNHFGIDILAVHLNHNFRPGDAERDAEYVRTFCDRIGIPSIIEFCDVPAMAKNENLSPEQAGRRARYDLFYRVMEERNFNKIAVAHNRDDQVETVLMRLIRGSGVEGLGGIQPVRGCIIRPLIDIPRYAIEDYCKKQSLKPVIDLSNFKPVYTRNKIRLELIPYLKQEFNPGIDRVLVDTANILRCENEYFQKITLDEFKGLLTGERTNRIAFDAYRLSELHDAILRRILRMAVEKISGSTDNISYTHIEAMYNLVKANKTGTQISLPGSITAGVSYGEFYLSREERVRHDTIDKIYTLNIPGTVTIDETGCKINAVLIPVKEYKRIKNTADRKRVFVDFGKTGGNIVVTGRRDGDRFVPLGMKGTKKLKDFFIDNKVPREKRDSIPIVRNDKGIIWVTGYRIDDGCKIDSATDEVLMLEYNQSALGEE